MNSPQFKEGNIGVYNEKVSFDELRYADFNSLINLYIAKILMYVAILLVLLNNLNFIAPGSYFGAFNWVTIVVFSIGIFINFFSIPFLYFSSSRNLNKEIDFWNKEVFWILPLFFFGTFFLYNSKISLALTFLIISLIVISIVHVKFFVEARKNLIENMHLSVADHEQYFVSLKYLTAYYILLLMALIFFDPIMKMFVWIRLCI